MIPARKLLLKQSTRTAGRRFATTPYGPSNAGSQETSNMTTKLMAGAAVVFGAGVLGFSAQPSHPKSSGVR